MARSCWGCRRIKNGVDARDTKLNFLITVDLMTSLCRALHLRQIFTLPKLADLQFITCHVKWSISLSPAPRRFSFQNYSLLKIADIFPLVRNFQHFHPVIWNWLFSLLSTLVCIYWSVYFRYSLIFLFCYLGHSHRWVGGGMDGWMSGWMEIDGQTELY